MGGLPLNSPPPLFLLLRQLAPIEIDMWAVGLSNHSSSSGSALLTIVVVGLSLCVSLGLSASASASRS